MLSICIAVKNRSRVSIDGRELLLFPNCVRSIVESVSPGLTCELVVTDWTSDDWPLDEWLKEAAQPVPVRVVRATGSFSRGRGLNLAAAAADGDYLFFTDADSLLCTEVVTAGMRYLDDGKAFFPVLYSFNGPEHDAGWWRYTGFGNCMVTRQIFKQAGCWPEYKSWGREDDLFFSRVSQVTTVVREQVSGFFHQWHPEDILWKDRYGERDPADVEEIQQARTAARKLARLIPPGQSLILVDDARFGIDEIEGRKAYPFLETAGEYAGCPENDEMAIRELERLRDKGATFIAFAWMSFWWLEHYARFAAYLRSTYTVVLEDDRLKVFDMRIEGKS